MTQITSVGGTRQGSFNPYEVIAWKDIQLCEIALTHMSASNELDRESNERLEFLGDAVLDLLCGELLILRYPSWGPGRLSRQRGTLVCRPAIARRAREIDLGRWLLLGKGAEREGLRGSEKVLGDALEALVGAAYLDGGMNGLVQARTVANRVGLLP